MSRTSDTDCLQIDPTDCSSFTSATSWFASAHSKHWMIDAQTGKGQGQGEKVKTGAPQRPSQVTSQSAPK